MATLRDVARLAGTSVSAAAEVLNGSGKHNIRVGADTRARILSAARNVEYRPNAIARALSSKRTNIIGLYSGYRYLDPRNGFFAEIMGGLQEGCLEHRKDLLLHSVFRGDSVLDIYSELLDGRIDGLVMNAPPEDPLVARLAASDLPVVVVADAVPSLPSVVVDDVKAAHLTFDHLIKRGHIRFLYRTADRRVGSAQRRQAAYFQVASQRGLNLNLWPGIDGDTSGNALLDAWLSEVPSRRPTAVLCWNDLAAYELLEQCHRRGVAVPQEMAVVGFDGDPNPIAFRWRLTTIRAPWAEVARTALQLLVERIEAPHAAEEAAAQEIILPVELIVGDSG